MFKTNTVNIGHEYPNDSFRNNTRYLLWDRTIAIDVDPAEYLAYTLLPLIQLVQVIIIKQRVQLLRLDKLLFEQLFEALYGLVVGCGTRLDFFDKYSHKELAQLINCYSTVSIDINFLELLRQFLSLCIVHTRQLDTFVNGVGIR